jgi:hypothetical protein
MLLRCQLGRFHQQAAESTNVKICHKKALFCFAKMCAEVSTYEQTVQLIYLGKYVLNIVMPQTKLFSVRAVYKKLVK